MQHLHLADHPASWMSSDPWSDPDNPPRRACSLPKHDPSGNPGMLRPTLAALKPPTLEMGRRSFNKPEPPTRTYWQCLESATRMNKLLNIFKVLTGVTKVLLWC